MDVELSTMEIARIAANRIARRAMKDKSLESDYMLVQFMILCEDRSKITPEEIEEARDLRRRNGASS